jgi:hypothetical protein
VLQQSASQHARTTKPMFSEFQPNICAFFGRVDVSKTNETHSGFGGRFFGHLEGK